MAQFCTIDQHAGSIFVHSAQPHGYVEMALVSRKNLRQKQQNITGYCETMTKTDVDRPTALRVSLGHVSIAHRRFVAIVISASTSR